MFRIGSVIKLCWMGNILLCYYLSEDGERWKTIS